MVNRLSVKVSAPRMGGSFVGSVGLPLTVLAGRQLESDCREYFSSLLALKGSGPNFADGGLNFVSPRTQAKPPERIESAEASTTSLVRQMFAPQGMRRHPDRSQPHRR